MTPTNKVYEKLTSFEALGWKKERSTDMYKVLLNKKRIVDKEYSQYIMQMQMQIINGHFIIHYKNKESIALIKTVK